MANLEPCDQPGQGDLGRIGHSTEHRFAEESPAELHAIKPPNQLSLVPAFDRVGMAHGMKAKRRPLDHLIDPSLIAVRAGEEYLMKCLIPGHGEATGPDPLRE